MLVAKVAMVIMVAMVSTVAVVATVQNCTPPAVVASVLLSCGRLSCLIKLSCLIRLSSLIRLSCLIRRPSLINQYERISLSGQISVCTGVIIPCVKLSHLKGNRSDDYVPIFPSACLV